MRAVFDAPLEPQTEEWLARIEGIVEQMDQRLTTIEATRRDMNARMVTALCPPLTHPTSRVGFFLSVARCLSSACITPGVAR